MPDAEMTLTGVTLIWFLTCRSIALNSLLSILLTTRKFVINLAHNVATVGSAQKTVDPWGARTLKAHT